MAVIPGWDSVEGAASLSKGFAVAGFVALFFVVIFDVLAFVYSNRKDALVAAGEKAATEERVRQEEEVSNQRNAQIAEANRRASEAQKRAEQLEEHAAPRILSEAEKNKISAFLVKEPRGAFVIKANVTVADARAYADQIAELFRSAGWIVRVDNALITGPNTKGLWITVKNGEPAPAPVAAVVLQRAFAVGGMTVRAEYDPTMQDSGEIWLSVGSK